MVQMRRLFSLVLLLFFLGEDLAANEQFLLPENKSDMIHTLKQKIERAQKVTIITAHLNTATLSRSLEKAIRHKHSFTLITTDQNSAAFYAKYKSTSVFVPPSARALEAFSINILLIDNSDVCFSSLPFDDKVLRRETGWVSCTTDQKEIAFGKKLANTFIQRFEPYNE